MQFNRSRKNLPSWLVPEKFLIWFWTTWFHPSKNHLHRRILKFQEVSDICWHRPRRAEGSAPSQRKLSRDLTLPFPRLISATPCPNDSHSINQLRSLGEFNGGTSKAVRIEFPVPWSVNLIGSCWFYRVQQPLYCAFRYGRQKPYQNFRPLLTALYRFYDWWFLTWNCCCRQYLRYEYSWDGWRVGILDVTVINLPIMIAF